MEVSFYEKDLYPNWSQLESAISGDEPDGETIVTGAGDETLRFWKVFPKGINRDKEQQSIIDPNNFNIR